MINRAREEKRQADEAKKAAERAGIEAEGNVAPEEVVEEEQKTEEVSAAVEEKTVEQRQAEEEDDEEPPELEQVDIEEERRI